MVTEDEVSSDLKWEELYCVAEFPQSSIAMKVYFGFAW